MKKLLSMILALSMALSMAACGGSPAQPASSPEPEAPASETASVSDVPEITPEPTPAEPEESAVEEAEEKPEITDTVDAGSVIVGVKTIGFIDADGAKQKAIAVEYNTKIDGSTVALEDYEIENYSILHGTLQEGAAVSQEPGVPVRVYVNDVPETAEEGLDAGNYVIIEVGTDYLLSNVPQYEAAMIAGVKQVGEVTGETAIVLPGSDFVLNYAEGEDDGGPFGGPMDFGGPDGGFGGPDGGFGGPGGPDDDGPPLMELPPLVHYDLEPDSYVIENIAGYELFYKSDDERYDPAHPAFQAEHCFEEATGEYVDVELPYALYVPEDYDASKQYALVLHVLDAGSLSSDPMVVLTEGQAPANYASEEVQSIVRDQGLGGIIVVSPAIEMSIRTTRDNWTTSAAVPATWQLMDAITEQYSIDMDHIYGTGQSMGGMQVMAMAGQRDNYFAGLWLLGMQWGNNYNKEVPYEGASYYNSDDPTIWREDADGKDSDLGRNWYYLLSDDNVLFTNCLGDEFSTKAWKEMDYLFQDMAGAEISKTAFHPLDESVEDQNAKLEALLEADSGPINYHWQSFDGGSHMMTWVYGHRLSAGYTWLLTQSRQAEQDRKKLEALNRPWKAETDPEKIAAKQTEDRMIGTLNDESIYFAVPAEDAGTIGYNSALYGRGGGSIVQVPGWTAE